MLTLARKTRQSALDWRLQIKPRLALLLVAFTCAVSAWSLYDARLAIHHDAEQQAANITVTLEHELERAMMTLDLSLQSAVNGMNIPNLASMPNNLQQAILFDGATAAEGLRGVFILDENGDAAFRSKTAKPPTQNLRDRDFFQKNKSSDGGLIVSGPIQSRADGEWVLSLSRRITRPDGSFGGVAVTGIQTSYFQGQFSKLNLDSHGIVILFTTEGRSVFRLPREGTEIGGDVRRGKIFLHSLVKPTGTFDAVASVDGIKRLFVYRQLANLPLVVAVGFSTDDIYQGWVLRSEVTGAIILTISTLYFFLNKSLLLEMRRRVGAEQEAKKAQAVAERLTIQMSESLARRDALVNNTADSMIVARVDATGEFLYESVNPVWERLTGIPVDGAINRGPRDCLPGSVAEAILSGWGECVRKRSPVSFAYSYPHADDEHEYWECLACPVFSTNGMVQRVIAVARDVTEQKKLQDKLRDAHRMQAVGELTAGIAHDFNNLLQAMLGALEVAAEQTGLDEDGHLCIEIARDAATRGASLVHHLLAFSCKQRLNPKLLHPKQTTAEIMSAVGSVLGKEYHFSSEVSDDAGPVLADQDQLSRSLMNLVLNARDASPNGGSLRLRVCAAGNEEAVSAGVEPGHYTRFILEDEGTGIPADMLARVFEPFFTTKDIGEGPGLGLPMVQGFARQSGGDVTVESIVGVGTAVSLWLPCAKTEEQHTPLAGNATPLERSGLRRVLVVDDEASVRQTLSLILRRAGYEPVLAETGDDALAILQQGTPFDLLVTDQSMPGMTGTALIEEVIRLRPTLPTMLISGYERVTGIERLQGRVTVLNKPFEGNQFIRQVQALLNAAALCGILDGENAPKATTTSHSREVLLTSPS